MFRTSELQVIGVENRRHPRRIRQAKTQSHDVD